MKLKACERCGKRTAEGLTLCPDCMKESGAAAEAVAAAEERTITDIVCQYSAQTGEAVFLYELDGRGPLVKIQEAPRRKRRRT